MSRRVVLALALLGLAPVRCAQFAGGDPLARGREWLGEVRLPPRNYVRNGGFEAGLEGWQYFVHKAGGVAEGTAFAGNACFGLEGMDETRHVYLYQYRVPLATGKAYTLSAALRTEGLSQANCEFGVLFLTNYGWTESAALKPAGPTSDWTVLRTTFTAFPTRPRPDGKPDYSLVLYWPPKSQGRVWIDNVQIEEGDQATAFSDLDLRPGIGAVDRLPGLAARVLSAREALAAFPEGPLIAGLRQEVARVRGEAEAVRADLRRYEVLDDPSRAALRARLDAAEAALAASQTVVWAGPAHNPLSDVTLPGERPADLTFRFTCVQDEHRDVAINVANLTATGFDARLELSPLYCEALATAVSPPCWSTAYSVPRIRGFARPDQLFSDPLPELGNAGVFHVEPADISQVILSVTTETLLPGRYTGVVTVSSLADKALRQDLSVTLDVLPCRLPPLTRVDVADCYGYVDYAWRPMVDLGVNTFTMPVSWMDVEFGPAGALTRSDFTRLRDRVWEICPAVPDARFLFLTMQGMVHVLESRYGWTPDAAPFGLAMKAWLAWMAAEMQALGIEASRLIIETFDEPGPGDLAAAVQMARWVHEAAPGVQTQFYASGVSREPAWQAAAKEHDIVAPSVGQCSPGNLAMLKGLGRRLWVYDCQANGETFDPLAYYRLMPWMCWAHGITGWGHFHWFNTSHDRPYRAWDGVEAQNLVYPGQPGTAPVLSRRYLAIRAGHEDYRLLQALDRAVERATPAQAEAVGRARAFLQGAGLRALELSPRQPHYETHIVDGLPPDRLDRMREEAVERLGELHPGPGELEGELRIVDGGLALAFAAPARGQAVVCRRTGGGWSRDSSLAIAAGPASVPLVPAHEGDHRWVVLQAEDGWLWVGSWRPIPRVAVDSCAPSYTARPLNDGIRIAAVKFEPQTAWISSGEAAEHWVELEFGKPRQVSEVGLWWMTFTGLPRKTMVRYLDGTEWKPVSSTPDWRPATGPAETVSFRPVTTSRLRVVQAAGGGGPGGPNLMGLSEVEVR